MASKRGWAAPFVVEAGLSVVLGDVCEIVGGYAERVGGGEPAAEGRFDPFLVSDLARAHGEYFRGKIPDAGVFRTADARVMRGAQVAFVPPQPSMTLRMTEDLFGWMEEPGEHLMIASAIFHYQLLFIHPFSDGNGRIARLWHALLLERWRPSLGTLDLENAVSARKQEYLTSLERSDRQKNASPFVLFMLGILKPEILSKMDHARAKSGRFQTDDRLSDFMERLLAVFEGRTLTGSEIMKGLKMSHRGTFRNNYLDPAIGAGYVEMTQPDSPRSPTQKYRLTRFGREAAQKAQKME
ncbi:MAG: Fic family protein [Synergistaceae bacterium]|jgi:Fic family protein|nr:Fic family protein [Synergistaceae bacterium]